jgi:GTP pyrophosphokinase
MTKTFSDIGKLIKNYLSDKDQKLIRRAFDFAKKIHQNQKRKTGDPYISHPEAVTYYLAKLKLDAATLSAALLHDVIEESSITIQALEKEFGKEIAQLVEGVTKTGEIKLREKISYTHGLEIQVRNLRKMFLVMAKDLRVVLIRLYDRLHNMQTLYALPKEKQLRIAQETLEIYAPLAHRLGMGELKGTLEDLAFPYVYPKEYRELKKMISDKFSERQKYIEKVKNFFQQKLDAENISATIDGRAKHLYSLYEKLLKYDNEFDKIYDLVALRIIVSSIADCYKVLGIVHDHFKPLPGRIKDYIAVPKPNGYQSLHTTVFCLEGIICEIQIRTYKMHEQAENGVAAHWHYGEKKKADKTPSEEISWVKELSRWRMFPKKSQDFINALKIDIFSDRIFAFSPKGEIKDLPLDATPIDFAYEIHTDLGNQCIGAKINGKIAVLNAKIQNGDIVEIVTRPGSKPKEDWLTFTKTAKARYLIRDFLKSKRQRGLI